jgi:hypothetical protein
MNEGLQQETFWRKAVGRTTCFVIPTVFSNREESDSNLSESDIKFTGDTKPFSENEI